MVVLAAVVLSRDPAYPIATVMAGGIAWGAISALAYRQKPEFVTSPLAIATDLALAGAAIVVGNAAEESFWGGLPLIAVAIAAIRGRRNAWITAGVLLVVVVGSVSSNPTGNIILDNLSEIIFYGAGAFIFGWVVSLLRRTEDERLQAEMRLVDAEAKRVRAEERAEISRHIHDSVLQTLALVQRGAENRDEVVALARNQEHELRSWLFGDHENAAGQIGEGLREAAREVEQLYRVVVDVVVVGDGDVGERGTGLLAAAKEAMVNAARHGGGGPVSVFAEITELATTVFVRDRGPGFQIDQVSADRKGVTESIIGRLESLGGSASLRSDGERGTEWRLEVSRV